MSKVLGTLNHEWDKVQDEEGRLGMRGNWVWNEGIAYLLHSIR